MLMAPTIFDIFCPQFLILYSDRIVCTCYFFYRLALFLRTPPNFFLSENVIFAYAPYLFLSLSVILRTPPHLILSRECDCLTYARCNLNLRITSD